MSGYGFAYGVVYGSGFVPPAGDPVVAVGYTDALPSPRVEVTVSPTSGAQAYVTVYRTTLSERTVVRGASRRPVAGPVLVVDYEAPFGVPITYVAETFDAAGVIHDTLTATTTVTLNVDSAWWSSPLTPALALPITRGENYAAEQTYSSDVSAVGVLGRGLLALLSDQRRPSQGTYDVVTVSALDDALLRALLTDAPSVVARHPASWNLGTLYIAFPDVVETRWAYDPTKPGRTWVLSGFVTGGPSPLFQAPFHTWDDVLANHETWGDVVTAKPTWLDLLRDPT